MNVSKINQALFSGKVDLPGLFPHLELLEQQAFRFEVNFGLESIPEEPGILLIRGARQYGKSTWLESALKESVLKYGPGGAGYLNGDYIKDVDSLESEMAELLGLLSPKAKVHRLFVDEITSVANWQLAVKRLADSGQLANVLLVTTGSKATDLRRGAERLPGRKGKLDRNQYLFTPVSYKEFSRRCGARVGDAGVWIYLLAGGCPLALSELVSAGRMPEYLPTMIHDWVYGECAASGRNRSSLLSVMEVLCKFGGAPIGQAKLAREAGLANNTVAAGYVELLSDLMVVGSSHAWDASRKGVQRRKPAKYPFINLLAAVAWDQSRMRTVDDFLALPAQRQGVWLEWLVAQELWRRAAIRGEEIPEELPYWKSAQHELDFVLGPNQYLEVKRGRVSPLEFGWFVKTHPRAHLEVVSQEAFEANAIQGLTLSDFLLQAD